MKVVIVTTEYATATSGGVQSVVDFVVSGIRECTNWQMEIASLRMSRRAGESLRLLNASSWFTSARTSIRHINGLVVHDIGSACAEVEYFRFLPRRWLDSILSKADVVLVVSGTPAVCNVTRRVSPPTVLQVATMVKYERASKNAALKGVVRLSRQLTTWITSRLDESGLRAADSVLVENEQMLQICESRKIKHFELCPPGVDVHRFRPISSRPKPERPYILLIARLGDSRKNVADLLRAFARARAFGGISQDLLLAGLSRPDAEVIRLIDELGLGSVVHIHSPLSEHKLVELYQHADFFASTSFEEGLGLAFLEAMACGLPVVTTDTAGARYVLGDSGAGTIVSHGPGLVDRFASELRRWGNDENLRLQAGSEARERVMAMFSSEKSAERFVAALKAAVRRQQEVS